MRIVVQSVSYRILNVGLKGWSLKLTSWCFVHVLFSVCHLVPRTHTLCNEVTTLGGGGPGVHGKMEREEAGKASIEEHSGA